MCQGMGFTISLIVLHLISFPENYSLCDAEKETIKYKNRRLLKIFNQKKIFGTQPNC